MSQSCWTGPYGFDASPGWPASVFVLVPLAYPGLGWWVACRVTVPVTVPPADREVLDAASVAVRERVVMPVRVVYAAGLPLVGVSGGSMWLSSVPMLRSSWMVGVIWDEVGVMVGYWVVLAGKLLVC